MRPAVGWIGLGAIGAPMAKRALDAGFALSVWARRSGQADALVAAGARRCADPESLARACELVVTIVGGPDDVDALHRRTMASARPGTLFVDLTTAAPLTAARSAERAASRACSVVDAPGTGGVAGAVRGSLTAFAGGEPDAIERARPLLETFCQRIVRAGGNGAGYRMKLVNQTIVAGVLLGLARGGALARAGGFDAATLRGALGHGTASGFLFDSYIERMIDGGGPVTFTLGLFRKDLRLARDEARERGLATAFLDFALDAVDAARSRHGDAAGVQVLALADPG